MVYAALYHSLTWNVRVYKEYAASHRDMMSGMSGWHLLVPRGIKNLYLKIQLLEYALWPMVYYSVSVVGQRL